MYTLFTKIHLNHAYFIVHYKLSLNLRILNIKRETGSAFYYYLSYKNVIILV